MDLISYPFRLNGDGTVSKTPDGEDYYAQEIAVLVKTVPGERPLVPDYGLEDPTFDELSKSILLSQIGLFGPPVDIGEMRSNIIEDGYVTLELEYFASDGENGYDDTDDDDDDNDYFDDTFDDGENDYYDYNDATD